MSDDRTTSPSNDFASERIDSKEYYEERGKDRWDSRSPTRRRAHDITGNDEAPNEGDTIHISNLPKDISEESLRKMFSIYGPVVSVTIPNDPRTGIGRGFGFVKMETIDEAAKALAGVQATFPDYLVELSKRSKPRLSTPGQYLGSEKNRRIPMRKYDNYDKYDRGERKYRGAFEKERYDRGYRPSYREYDRGYYREYDRGYDRYKYDRPTYSGSYDYDYHHHHRSPPSSYDYPYDDRYRDYPSERDRYYRGFPYQRPPHDPPHHHHHHHHESPPHHHPRD